MQLGQIHRSNHTDRSNRSGRTDRSWARVTIAAIVAAMALLIVPTTAAQATVTVAATPALDAAGTAVTAAAPTAWHKPRLTYLVSLARKATTMKIPYSNGGHGVTPAPLGTSEDCSGLIRTLYYAAFGVDIGRGTGDSTIRTSGEFTQTSHPVPGDIVLIGYGGRAPAYHAMIYVGNDGGQPTAVASANWGEYVKYQYPASAYWASSVMGYWHYRGATAADSGSLTPPPATGAITAITGAVNAVTVSGWAYDAVKPTTAVRVDIYVNGSEVTSITASDHRSDGRPGWHATVAAPTGQVSVKARINAAAGTGAARSFTSTAHTVVTRYTTGHLDAVTGGLGTVRVTGWSYDYTVPNASNRARVYVDGRAVTEPLAARPSADVDRALRIGGNHRFDIVVPAAPGPHQVCVLSLSAGRYGTSHTLGCRTVTVTRYTTGHVDSVTATAGQIRVTGWAYDYNTPGRSSLVRIYYGTRFGQWPAANSSPDVDRALHVTGNHRFDVTTALPAGSYRVCVLALTMSGSSVSHELGCATVTVPAA